MPLQFSPTVNRGAYNKLSNFQGSRARFAPPLYARDFSSPEAYSEYASLTGGAGGGYGSGATPISGGFIPSTTGTGTAGGGGSTPGFNLNPSPQAGQGAFGAVPGPLGLPNPAGDLAKQVPGLSNLNAQASGNILSKLNGTLSPGTLNALQNAQAQYGVASGMPGSGLSWNSLYGNIAGAAEQQQQQGLQDYNSFIPTVSGTQTVNPALQNEIATQNSLNAAAPNPTAAASYAKQLFDQYLASMRGPGGGTRGGGGTGPGGGTRSAPPTSIPGLFGNQGVQSRTIVDRAAPSGSFGGSSSFNPSTWADWEDEMYGPVNDFIPDYGNMLQDIPFDSSYYDDYEYA